MTKYFGNYQQGAYWLYLNRDSTKRDSVWVDNFETRTITDKVGDCLSANELSFAFHSRYIFKGVSRFALGFNGDAVATNALIAIDSSGRSYGGIYAENGKANFFSGSDIFPIVSNYPLWPNNSATYLPEVSVIGNLVVAPEIGFVQLADLTTKDTFSLVKFYKP